MAWTTPQKTNLNNSMSAAQDVSLGTVIDELVTKAETVVASGCLVTAAATTTIVTGLGTITSVTATLNGAPTLVHDRVVATAGSVAGTIVLAQYRPTSVSNPTPTSASAAPWVPVFWTAVGTD